MSENEMAPTSPRAKIRDIAEERAYELEQSQRRLQRVLRSPEPEARPSGLRPAVTERQKEAALSPSLISPGTLPDSDEPLYQCTECDMIVKKSDPYCPFCGAIFADGPLANESSVSAAPEGPEAESQPRLREERRPPKEPPIRPERFDVFSLVRSRPRYKEMAYEEARRGFGGSARLLEGIEELVSEVSSLGRDTSSARRLICSAWEACREGDWNLVTTLARQAEESLTPSIPDLVRSQIAKARANLARAKVAGVDISSYLTRVKDVMAALNAREVDEALRLTKELTDSLREDSVLW